MIKVIPAILATTEEEYYNKISEINNSGLFDWIQIDLMDNKFVQNQSIEPDVIAKYKTNLNLEAHLMVEYPENWIDELVKIPQLNRIIFPVEDREGITERITHIKNHGKQVGLAINPETDISILEPFLNKIDLVLIMSVHPGFQGQKFIPETVNKINEVLRLRSGFDFKIEIDGGISEENIKQVADAGADIAIIGSGLFKYDNLKVGLEKIQATRLR